MFLKVGSDIECVGDIAGMFFQAVRPNPSKLDALALANNGMGGGTMGGNGMPVDSEVGSEEFRKTFIGISRRKF
jgi:hypothetical protein